MLRKAAARKALALVGFLKARSRNSFCAHWRFCRLDSRFKRRLASVYASQSSSRPVCFARALKRSRSLDWSSSVLFQKYRNLPGRCPWCIQGQVNVSAKIFQHSWNSSRDLHSANLRLSCGNARPKKCCAVSTQNSFALLACEIRLQSRLGAASPSRSNITGECPLFPFHCPSATCTCVTVQYLTSARSIVLSPL